MFDTESITAAIATESRRRRIGRPMDMIVGARFMVAPAAPGQMVALSKPQGTIDVAGGGSVGEKCACERCDRIYAR